VFLSQLCVRHFGLSLRCATIPVRFGPTIPRPHTEEMALGFDFTRVFLRHRFWALDRHRHPTLAVADRCESSSYAY